MMCCDKLYSSIALNMALAGPALITSTTTPSQIVSCNRLLFNSLTFPAVQFLWFKMCSIVQERTAVLSCIDYTCGA